MGKLQGDPSNAQLLAGAVAADGSSGGFIKDSEAGPTGLAILGAATDAALAALIATAFGGVPEVQSQNSQSTDYTLALTDAGKSVRHNSGSPHAFTIPPNNTIAFPIGTRVTIINTPGGGDLTITRGSGVALTSTDGTPVDDDMVLSGGTRIAKIHKISTNGWVIEGGYAETP